MKTAYAALAIMLAAALVPFSSAQAQSYEDMIMEQKDVDPKRPRTYQDVEKNNNALYGEAEGGLSNDYDVDQDTNYAGPAQENTDISYDQAALPAGGPKDLYSYIGEDRDNSAASMDEKRSRASKKAHEEALKTQKAALKKLQANTDRLVKEQKERAWKLANPGLDYPGNKGEDGDATDGDGGSDGGDGDVAGTEDGGGEEAGENGEAADAGFTDDAGGGDGGDGGGDDIAGGADKDDAGADAGGEGAGDAGTEQADAGAADSVSVTNVQ